MENISVEDVFAMYRKSPFLFYGATVCTYMIALWLLTQSMARKIATDKLSYQKKFFKVHRFAIASLSGTMGAQNVLFAKGASTLLVLTISGNGLMFAHFPTYLILLGLFSSIYFQLRWLNSALKRFSALQVVPTFQSFWILVSVLGGLAVYEEASEAKLLEMQKEGQGQNFIPPHSSVDVMESVDENQDSLAKALAMSAEDIAATATAAAAAITLSPLAIVSPVVHGNGLEATHEKDTVRSESSSLFIRQTSAKESQEQLLTPKQRQHQTQQEKEVQLVANNDLLIPTDNPASILNHQVHLQNCFHYLFIYLYYIKTGSTQLKQGKDDLLLIVPPQANESKVMDMGDTLLLGNEAELAATATATASSTATT
ncbi:hypothetical protein RFI_08516, partial [Reticulomyxa filosa]